MIELRNVSLIIDGKTILSDISCTIMSGQMVMIVGHNGAGKSSLFNLIAGVYRPTSGTIFINGQDTSHWNRQKYTAAVRCVLQDPRQATVAELTVRQNVALAGTRGRATTLRNACTSVTPEQINHLQAALAQPDTAFLDAPASRLSGGQRQTLAFVMATLTPPPLLLLDEPTAALDPQAAQRLIKLVMQFTKHHATTTLWVTHDPHMAIALGTTLWVIEGGKLKHVYTGSAKQKLTPDAFTTTLDYAALARLFAH